MHVALLALKQEQIVALRLEVSDARARAERAEQARDAAIAKAFEVMTARPIEMVALPRERRAAPPELDLSRIDPSDNSAIRDLALNEMPGGKANASLLQAKMENIRTQVRAAHAAKAARAREVGAMAEPPPKTVNDQIEAAIAAGRERAR